MKGLAYIVFALSFWIQPVKAEETSLFIEGGLYALIFNNTKVVLEVSDQVTDGCMRSPDSIERYAEAALRRNKLSVVDKANAMLPPTVKVTALGFGTNEYNCAVHFSLTLTQYTVAQVPYSAVLDGTTQNTIIPVGITIYSTILSGPKDSMQERLERETESAVNELFITIDRAKDHVKQNWPKIYNLANGSDSP